MIFLPEIKSSKFQLIVLGVFVAFIAIGVILFATIRGGGEDVETQRVIVWGPMSPSVFDSVLYESGLLDSETVDIQYTQVQESRFDEIFVDALAEGQGPDLVIISHEKLVKHKSKLAPIPYTTISERSFLDTFVDQVELAMFPEGSYMVPIIIDPLIMYWNKTLFGNAGFSQVPRDWESFKSNYIIPLTQKTGALEIRQSATALGEYDNVAHAKDILAMLSLQAGTPIIHQDDNGRLRSQFSDQLGYTVTPAIAALNFYTEFSDPQKILYSWNRSLANSYNEFLSGDLAMYFGYASEFDDIKNQNPNLDFDIATVPQPKQINERLTYGRMYGFAIPRQSKSFVGSFEVIQGLTSAVSTERFADLLYVAPARADVAGSPQADARKSVVYDSAIISEGWLDPEPQITEGIFANMIRSITNGTARSTEAVSRAGLELSNLVR